MVFIHAFLPKLESLAYKDTLQRGWVDPRSPLQQFYNIATKVSSRKSATTFVDLPDWLSVAV